MYWIFEHVRAEWDTIKKAPFLLFLLFVFGLCVGWLGSRVLYEQDLQTLRDQNGYLQSKVNPIEPSMVASAVASPIISQVATPTPINSAELEALKDESDKLKTENARLRKLKTPHHIVAALPLSSPCASITPILIPSKVSVGDCDALVEIHELLDNAIRQRGDAGADTSRPFKRSDTIPARFRDVYFKFGCRSINRKSGSL